MDRRAVAYAPAGMTGLFGSCASPAAAQHWNFHRYWRIATAPMRQRDIRTCAVGRSRGAEDRLLARARSA